VPRPKSHRGLDACVVEPLSLPDNAATSEVRETLVQLAGLSPNSRAAQGLWTAVCDALASYPALQSLEPSSPGPASLRQALAIVDRHVTALQTSLRTLDCSASDELIFAGVSPSELLSELQTLERALAIADRNLERHESRAIKAREARRWIVAELSQTFQNAAELNPEEYSHNLQDFIIQACGLTGIDLPRDDRVLELVPASLKVQKASP
jgi:hypothetical protein